MSELRNQKLKDEVRQLASAFIEQESNRKSMITITNVESTSDFKSVTIFVTVFPERYEVAVLDFLNRKKSEIRDHFKRKGRLSRIPFISIELDKGEKSRQRIEEISKADPEEDMDFLNI